MLTREELLGLLADSAVGVLEQPSPYVVGDFVPRDLAVCDSVEQVTGIPIGTGEAVDSQVAEMAAQMIQGAGKLRGRCRMRHVG